MFGLARKLSQTENHFLLTVKYEGLKCKINYTSILHSNHFQRERGCHPCHRFAIFLSTHVEQTTVSRATHCEPTAATTRSCFCCLSIEPPASPWLISLSLSLSLSLNLTEFDECFCLVLFLLCLYIEKRYYIFVWKLRKCE